MCLSTHLDPVDSDACFGGENAHQLLAVEPLKRVVVENEVRRQQSVAGLREGTNHQIYRNNRTFEKK